MEHSDAAIIQAILDGDADRYAELVDRYQDQAIRIAFGFLGNYEDARDVSQEAFVRAYRALGRFRGGAKFSTWLYRIIVNACKDHHRRRAREPLAMDRVGEPDPDAPLEGLFVEVDDPAAGPRDQLANRELGRRLSTAIEGLPMKQRSAFLLHHVHGLPLRDVAQVMGCRVGTVKAHVFRATEQLRVRMSAHLAQEGLP
jgi:RNA polymerase sigma-70 factor (ECF subfamily)